MFADSLNAVLTKASDTLAIVRVLSGRVCDRAFSAYSSLFTLLGFKVIYSFRLLVSGVSLIVNYFTKIVDLSSWIGPVLYHEFNPPRSRTDY